MMCADWLQGPYVYALYRYYGYNISEIGVLFIVGFGSSMVFGTLVGSAADKYGRKKLCLVFGLLYSLSCLTKHVHDFRVLLVGRLLGGVSTSILFSSFESWMVHEHHAAKYPDEWLGQTFSLCTTGNGIVAILSGVVASLVREQFGPVAPFDVSLICLVCGSCLVAAYWPENTGDASIDLSATLANAFTKLRSDPKIVYLGVIQSFFEGAMYIFVFMWTPALEATSPFQDQLISHGWIFAGFMVRAHAHRSRQQFTTARQVRATRDSRFSYLGCLCLSSCVQICVLIGSTLFQHFLDHSYRVERTTLWMIMVAGGSLLLPAVVESHTARLASFLVFEVCVGLFWPSLGFLRSKYVPEDCRATTMNFFRIPLNLIVVVVLANIGSLSSLQVFLLCFAVLMPALGCQLMLLRVVEHEAATNTGTGGAYGKVPTEVAAGIELQPRSP